MAIKASWKTNHAGTFCAGIPARSLSDEDWEALSKEDRERVEESGLWSVRGEDAPTPHAAVATERKADAAPGT